MCYQVKWVTGFGFFWGVLAPVHPTGWPWQVQPQC
jgi:hypothetical protein